MRRTHLTIAIVGLMTMTGAIALAQRGPGGPGGGPPDPEAIRERIAEMQQRMYDAMRERLEISEEEWEVIQPRVERVVDMRRQTASGGMGMGMFMFGGDDGPGRRGGPGGRGGRGRGGPGGGFNPFGGEPTEVDERLSDLREVVEQEEADAEALNEALGAVREARSKQEAEFEEAQASLRELLTLRQEAMLVGYGLLD